MADLVLHAAPLFAMVRPRLEVLGLLLTQAIDAFAEARMRNALPARLLQAERGPVRGNAAPPRTMTAVAPAPKTLGAPQALGNDAPVSKESLRCSF
jgi:hypothetical protein